MKHADSAEHTRVLDILDAKNWDATERLGGAMELRVSVRSLVHQLVHEQAKASVHLAGLQRDVTTLLDFREWVMDGRPAVSGLPRPGVTVPPAGSATAPPTDPVTGAELTSAGTSGLGTSTSTGTSTSGGVSTGASTGGGASSGAGAGGGAEPGASAATCRGLSGAAYRPLPGDDELMSLLESIEMRGRQLLQQEQRRRAAEDSPAPLESAGSRLRTGPAGARPRCADCDRVDSAGVAGSSPAAALSFGARPRSADSRRTSGRLAGGLAADDVLPPLLPDWPPGWERPAGISEAPPLSLPDLRAGQERLAALSLSERLLQERDVLLQQVTGLEQVAVRSQLHAAGLQTRLHRLLAVTPGADLLDRELRLTGGPRLGAGPAPAAGGGRTARSTPDLRPPSRIPQPLSLRRHRTTRQVTGSRSCETQTSGAGGAGVRSAVPAQTPHLVDAGITTSVVATALPEVCTASVGTSTTSLPAASVMSADHRSAPPPPPPSVRPPDRARVSAILRETSPLRLQKQLLTLLVEAEALRAQVASLGRRWAARVSPAGGGAGEAEQAGLAAAQADNDDIRLQLEMRNIELEGTRARLRQLESSLAARSGTSDARSSDLGVSPGSSDTAAARLSLSPRLSRHPPALPVGRNSPTPGSRLGKVSESGNPSDSVRAAGRLSSVSPGVIGGQERSAGTRHLPSTARRSTSQRDPSPGRERLPVVSSKSEAQRQLPSVSVHRPGASLTPKADKRPDTPTKSSRSSAASSRPGSRCDTPSGRPHSRSKTPTRPSSRSNLSTTPGNSLRNTTTSGNSLRAAGSSCASPKPSPGSGSAVKASPGSGSSVKPSPGSGSAVKPSAVSGSAVQRAPAGGRPVSPGRPVWAAGRRVADLVRGWTESVDPQRQAADGPTTTGGGGGGGGGGGTEHPDKIRRRGVAAGETSAKIPATQSQALGQILTALSRGHSPRAPARRTDPPPPAPAPALQPSQPPPAAETRPEVGEFRSAAEIRWLREVTARRLRQARLETSDGEVADSLTSATASEDGADVSLEERLKLLDPAGGVSGGGGGGYGQGMVLSAGEGLIQRILSGRAGGPRVKPRPAAD